MRPGTLLRYRALRTILPSFVKPGDIVYDLGGYDGYILNKLKARLPSLAVTIVDTNPVGLRAAEQNGLRTLSTSALVLPEQDRSIDVILCLDLIEHVVDDRALVAEISRTLKSNGTLVLTTVSENGVTFPFLSKSRTDLINRQWGHVRTGYRRDSLISLLEKEGLTVVRTSRYFNVLSRFIYRFSFIDRLPFMTFFFRLVVLLEPYVKIGAQEHIVIARQDGPAESSRS